MPIKVHFKASIKLWYVRPITLSQLTASTTFIQNRQCKKIKNIDLNKKIGEMVNKSILHYI